MDDKYINKMYLDSFISEVYVGMINVRNMTSIMTDIGKTWRQIKPEGTIGDEQIKKIEELRNNVFQACDNLGDKLSANMDTEKLPEDIEGIGKLVTEIKQLSGNMYDKFNAFYEWYSKLSKTFFNEEYDR